MVNSKPCVLKVLKRPVGAAPEKEYITKFMDKNANLKKAHFYQKKHKKHLPKKSMRRKKHMCFLKTLCTTPATTMFITV